MGTDIFHSDYFSGWDETELQTVLDNCENPSEAANPDAFCSDWLTFRGKPKEEGVQVDDDEIESELKKIQPTPIDTKTTISPEDVTDVSEVPRGTCKGTLISDTDNPSPSPPTTDSPSPTASPCKDIWNVRKCRNKRVKSNCQKTCSSCGNDSSGSVCRDIWKTW